MAHQYDEIAKAIVTEHVTYCKGTDKEHTSYDPCYFDQGYSDTNEEAMSAFVSGELTKDGYPRWRELAEDLGWMAVQLGPTDELEEDFKLTWLRLDNLQAAIDLIVSKRDTVNIRKQIVDDICSGDIDKFDSDTADVIVQVAMFGELMYG